MIRKISVVGLALVAVCAMGASSAFALESVWLVATAKPTAQVAVDSETTLIANGGGLLLEDMKGGILLEAVDILCDGTDTGFVGPDSTMSSLASENLLETVTVNHCETMSGTCPEPKVEAINLPWLSTVELIGTAFYVNLVTEKSGATTVGYKVTCSIISDNCEAPLGRALLENLTNGTVAAIFNPTDVNQPPATCSRGGAEQGLVEGEDILLTVSGAALAVSEA